MSQNYSIDTLNFNSKDNEFAPIKYGNKLVIVSNKKWKIIIDDRDLNSKRTTNIFVYDSTGLQLFDKAISSRYNEGPGCFTKNTDTLYFTSNNRHNFALKNQKAVNTLGIFYTIKKQEGWSDPVPLVINNKSYNVGHPFVDPFGKYLLFASDMPGGHGGTDLYISLIENGVVSSDPTNLGSIVNSKFNENYPYLNPANQLYFSSDRPSVHKGINIFSSDQRRNKTWSNPHELSAPINSDSDDFSIVTYNEGDEGWFSSNRGGDDDIYAFKFEYPVFEACEENHQPKYCYTFREHRTEVGDSIPVKFKWSFGDGESNYGSVVKHCYSDTGLYNLTLNLEDTISGLTYLEVAEMEVAIEKYNRPFITSLDSVKVREPITLAGHETDLSGYVVLEYYWEFADGSKKKGVSTTKTYDAPGYYYPILGVVALNQSTNEREKLCVYKEILVVDSSTQVVQTEDDLYESPDQFSHKHLESEVDTNLLTNLADTNLIFALQFHEDTALLDTSELMFSKVNGQVYAHLDGADSMYVYNMQYSKNLFELYPAFKNLVDSGFTPKIVGYDYHKLLSDTSLLKQMSEQEIFELFFITIDTAEIKHNFELFFDLNSHNIRENEKNDLLKFIDGVKISDFYLIIEGYTDATGTNKLNEALSLERAKSAQTLLLKAGIKKESMQVLSHGEKFAQSKSGKEVEDQTQRRVVITFIKK